MHFIAAFQVLIYVGAVMVFMVYAIMLLDVRDPSLPAASRACSCPASRVRSLLLGVLVYAAWPDLPQPRQTAGAATFGLREFSATS